MRKIVYHHIPKCGGMTISAGLALSYFPFHLLRYGRKHFPGKLNARAASETASYLGKDRYQYRRELLAYHLEASETPYIFGHYPFSSELAQRYGDQWTFVTLLRDPVKRWYSEYYWNRYKSHSYDKTALDIEAYFDSPQGQRDCFSFVNFLVPRQNPQDLPSEADIQTAIRNLDYFAVIGVLEDMEGFRSALAQAFGYKPVFIKRNVSPAPEEKKVIPPEDSDFHQKLLAHLAADMRIYKAVLERTKEAQAVTVQGAAHNAA